MDGSPSRSRRAHSSAVIPSAAGSHLTMSCAKRLPPRRGLERGGDGGVHRGQRSERRPAGHHAGRRPGDFRQALADRLLEIDDVDEVVRRLRRQSPDLGPFERGAQKRERDVRVDEWPHTQACVDVVANAVPGWIRERPRGELPARRVAQQPHIRKKARRREDTPTPQYSSGRCSKCRWSRYSIEQSTSWTANGIRTFGSRLASVTLTTLSPACG